MNSRVLVVCTHTPSFRMYHFSFHLLFLCFVKAGTACTDIWIHTVSIVYSVLTALICRYVCVRTVCLANYRSDITASKASIRAVHECIVSETYMRNLLHRKARFCITRMTWKFRLLGMITITASKCSTTAFRECVGSETCMNNPLHINGRLSITSMTRKFTLLGRTIYCYVVKAEFQRTQGCIEIEYLVLFFVQFVTYI
jgi:hypothetical protein